MSLLHVDEAFMANEVRGLFSLVGGWANDSGRGLWSLREDDQDSSNCDGDRERCDSSTSSSKEKYTTHKRRDICDRQLETKKRKKRQDDKSMPC